jgi:hypothetical protein
VSLSSNPELLLTMSTKEMRVHLPWKECRVAGDDGCLVALESLQRLLMEWRTAASHVVVNPLDPQSSSMESPFTAASVVTNGTLERPHQPSPILRKCWVSLLSEYLSSPICVDDLALIESVGNTVSMSPKVQELALELLAGVMDELAQF